MIPRNRQKNPRKRFVSFLFLLLFLALSFHRIFAQESASVLYVPLIGLTSVPEPLALPKGSGKVTYQYAVKNFLPEVPLTDIRVTDDHCSSVKFVTGDDNGDSQLGFDETWRFTCSTKLSQTTQSRATVTGTANAMTAQHTAYATVVVGSEDLPPLVSIINITKVAYPLSLPIEGGKISFTYKVSNPGLVPLTNVRVTDNKCRPMSGKLGDTNGNNLLDVNEVWIYTCSAILRKTTVNTVRVTAFSGGLEAVGEATLTVKVDVPNFPDAGPRPDIKTAVWKILVGILVTLIIFLIVSRKSQHKKTYKKFRFLQKEK